MAASPDAPPSRPTRAQPPWPRQAAVAVRDLRGGMRLVMDGVRLGITRVESAHDRMAGVEPPVRGARIAQPRTGWGAVLYHGLRGTADLAGSAMDLALASLQASLDDPRSQRSEDEAPSRRRAALLAALNAVAGDHLHRSDNPLAIRTRLLRRGGAATARVLVLAHDLGLDDLQWDQRGHDHGRALAEAFDCTPVHALYNTGRPVPATGRELASELQALLSHWPVPLQGVVLLGHGQGGLVLRSALHQAGRRGMPWPALVGRIVFLGTPHAGADPARVASWLSRIAAGPAAGVLPLARLARQRSAGMADFAAGRVLAEDPRTGAAPAGTDGAGLPPTLQVHAIAGAIGDGRSDGLVPVASALGHGDQEHAGLLLAEDHRWVAQGVDHMGLLASDAVLRRMRQWLSA